MSKFLLITKINLLRFLDIKRVTNHKYKSERKRNIFKVILSVGILLYLAFYVFGLTSYLLPGFILLNKPIYALGLMFSVTSMFIFFHNLFKVKTILFDFKDYDLLSSMPIKRNVIILSKIVSVYLLNLLYTIIIMVPAFIAYELKVPSSFGIRYFLFLFIIPIVPLVLSYIIGIVLSWLTSFFKNKNIGSYIVNFSLVIIIMFISLKISSSDVNALASSGVNVLDKVNNFYPLTNIFINLLINFHFTDLIIFITVPLILTYVFVLIINYFYSPIRNKLLRSNVKNDYIIKIYNHNRPLMTLYKKDFKKFVSSPLYILNTMFGCVLLIVFIIGIIIFNDDTLSRYLNIPNLGEFLKQNVILVIATICALSSTTYPSISLEGKSFWIMKMLPVSSDKIFISKIMVNLTFLIPTILISGTFFGIYLHFGLEEFLLIYLMPLMYSFFVAIIGLIYNLLFPKFDFENEVKVIKQSTPSLLTVATGLLTTLVPFTLLNINKEFMTLITFLLLTINIVLLIILHYYGARRIKML